MSSIIDFDGKKVVVTGAASGIGSSLLDVLDKAGAPLVTVLDVKKPSGPHDVFIETDMGDQESIDHSASLIGDVVDVLFNNAGIAATQSPERVMAVNFLGLRHLTSALLDRMPGGGAVVNTSSIAGNRWLEHLGSIEDFLSCPTWSAALEWIKAHSEAHDAAADSYAFSKEAIRAWGMLESRRMMKAGVRINSICPGPVGTPLLVDFNATMGEAAIDWTVQHGTGALMTPVEAAMPLAFLGSAAASYINGQDLIVDGGFTAAQLTGQLDLDLLRGAE